MSYAQTEIAPSGRDQCAQCGAPHGVWIYVTTDGTWCLLGDVQWYTANGEAVDPPTGQGVVRRKVYVVDRYCARCRSHPRRYAGRRMTPWHQLALWSEEDGKA